MSIAPRWISVVPGEQGDRVYALSDNGTIQRFDSALGEWNLLRMGGSSAVEPHWGELFSDGNDVYAFDLDGRGSLVRLVEDRIEAEQLNDQLADAFLQTAGMTT